MSRLTRWLGKKVKGSDKDAVLPPWENLLNEAILDAERYFKYSIPPGDLSRFQRLVDGQLEASATRQYHRIEKGFTLPVPRRPFGRERAKKALTFMFERQDTTVDPFVLGEARDAVDGLDRWNDDGVFSEHSAPRGDSLPTNPLDAETLARFLTSRHSIRTFRPAAVDHDLIRESVRLASYAPSVCNRQSWRAYYFDDPEHIARILALHAGSRGFSDQVPGLFVVTYDIRTFEDALERNQGWIDGGLFSMNLLLALHGLGLGAVPLNWSRRNVASAKIRLRAKLPEHENVVMLIALGHPADGYRVARSARRPVDQTLRFGMP